MASLPTVTESNIALRQFNLHVGYKFTDGKGHIYTITGYTSRRPKNPVHVVDSSTKKFKTSISFIKNCMQIK